MKSWWTCRFLTNLEMVSYDMDQSFLFAVKISSESYIRNSVKTLPFLQVPSWSLRGHGGSWRWCHMTYINHMKLLWKFHQNPTSGTLSRLYPSSKSLPGVFEEMMNLEMVSYDLYQSYLVAVKFSSESNIRPCEDFTCLPSPLSLGGHVGSWRIWR